MPAYCRLKDPAALAKAIAATGLSQAEICRRAGFSTVRMSQIVGGQHLVVRLGHALALEETLGVERGQLFTFAADVDAEVILAYLPNRGAA